MVSGLDNGEKQTLPGVNVYWENSRQGTVTGEEGTFRLRRRNGQDVLVFSFVGYETRKVHVHDDTPMEIVLEPNLEIGEVTVMVKDRGVYLSTIDPIHSERIGGGTPQGGLL